MYVIDISAPEREEIGALLGEVTRRYGSVEDSDFLDALTVLGQELPRRLRLEANRFRLQEPDGGCLVRGYTVDDERIGPTPTGWYSDTGAAAATLREDAFLLLCASLFGDPFGWATQQDGRLLHDVVPIKGHEDDQINSSTTAPLYWHTEDAFHPYRADYVALMCLRNPDAVETTFAAVSDVDLDAATVEVLSQARFVIRPDESHLPKNRAESSRLAASEDLLERAYAWVRQMQERRPKVPVLFGDPAAPYWRLDPYFMDGSDDDPEAAAALERLLKEIDAALTGVALESGQILLLDNYRSVHGRVPYRARFDGTDRWLRRVNVTRDLRKSRAVRSAPASRVIF